MLDYSRGRWKDKGLFWYSAKDLDTIGDVLVKQFDKDIFLHAHPFDIERFVELDQEYNVEFHNLSPDFKIYGCAVAEDGWVPVWSEKANGYVDIPVQGQTIIIDSRLDPEEYPLMLALYRVVLAHEAMHLQLQSDYLALTPDRLPCLHTDENHYRVRLINTFTAEDVSEWQANRAEIGLLMPLRSVLNHIDQMLPIIPGYDVFPEVMIQEIARTYQVTNELAFYRLVDLNKFQHFFGRVELKDMRFTY